MSDSISLVVRLSLEMTCMSLPTVTSAVRSSTNVPVYPCTAASVTIDNVSSMMTANRFTDSVEPLPLRPRLTSDKSGERLKKNCMIRGPAAPNLPRIKAPPIHNMNGPNTLIKPPTNQFKPSPSSLPFITSNVSIAPRDPKRKRVQCNQTFGFATF